MKSMQSDSQLLFDSQENIFQTISTVFTQSSQSTNVGEMEETLLQAMETGSKNVEESNHPSGYSLRNRVVGNQSVMLQLTPKSNSIRKISTGIKRRKQLQDSPTATENSNLESCSQESVSMLQECYQKNQNDFPELTETCLDSEHDEINIYSDDGLDEHHENFEKVENSTQTEFFPFRDDRSQELVKHATFISSVIRLKSALSAGKTISNKRLREIIQADKERTEPCGMEIDSETEVPKETIHYLLRSSDVENVFYGTVQVILKHLEKTLTEDFGKIACCWENSIYEMAVEMLVYAVDNDTGVWKLIDGFLCRTIETILNNEDKSKNLTLESKANFVVSFCHSAHLSCTAISFIIERLKVLKMIERRNEPIPASEKLSWTHLTKNSYYLLRLLESSLELLKTKIDDGKIGKLVKQPEAKYYNVLEMWKKHWNREESSKEQKSGHEWETMVGEWCRQLDEILLHCVNHIPIISAAVERCGESAKEILKKCHPTITALPVENWDDI